MGTEQDRWALHRNNALQLGNQIDRYTPREGKPTGCMLCEETKDSWAHREECKTAITWVKEWMREIAGEEPRDAHVKRALRLEEEDMTIIQQELYSKMWHAWYDMWKACRRGRLRTTSQKRSWWTRGWRAQLKRAVDVDLRKNEKKAKTKWKEVVKWEYGKWKLRF